MGGVNTRVDNVFKTYMFIFKAQALLSSGSTVRGGSSSNYKGRNPLSLCFD